MCRKEKCPPPAVTRGTRNYKQIWERLGLWVVRRLKKIIYQACPYAQEQDSTGDSFPQMTCSHCGGPGHLMTGDGDSMPLIYVATKHKYGCPVLKGDDGV